jgi:hypothetical protein
MCKHTWVRIPYSPKSKIYDFMPKHVAKTIQDMHSLASAKGGKCLSDKFINQKTPLKWQCAKGHIWEAKPMNIINRKQWCPECNINQSE